MTDSKIIGRVLATEKAPTTIDNFAFWTNPTLILNPFDITDNSKVYKCEHCGKEIKYDTDEIDYMPIFQPRDIFDEEQCNKISPTEYLDAQICEQTFGVVLCHDCLKKYIENNKKQK